ncbi:MAG: glutamate synthase central domain-containing protein, partial [Dehalococcoidia bacterium]
MAPDPSAPQGLYDPQSGRDACGTGFVAQIGGERSHRIVELAVEAVVNLTHRGAVNADPKTGDGAGVTIQIPFALLREDAARLGHSLDEAQALAVAMTFLPPDESDRPAARAILEQALRRSGLSLIGWRVVPTDPSVLGAWALDSLPGIEQLLLLRPEGMDDGAFDRALYLARRRAERAYREQEIDCYIVSMSARTVVYKGLMVAPQLGRFYADLTDPRTVSALALFHQRFATNTLPNWKLTQPMRYLAHNGEINTLLGNRIWMDARGPELTSPIWGDDIAELLPIITAAGSDSASLDEALDLLVTSGRDLLHTMMMLIPEAWENMPNMDPKLRSFYRYHACLQEPWDGPAAITFTDGTLAAGVMDRNGLRPARYQVTRDGLVVLGSEVGLIELDPADLVESGRLGPGQMIAVDTAEKRLLHNDAIKERYAGQQRYDEWVGANLYDLDLDEDIARGNGHRREHVLGDPLERQIIHGCTNEELEFVLKPMVRIAKEPTGSMGDDTPLSVLHEAPRLLYTYFRQKFAQVTNPPIDSIREKIVMSLDTYLGGRRSLLEEAPEAARLLHLFSPLLFDEDLARLRDVQFDGFQVTTLPAHFSVDAGPSGLRRGLDALTAAAGRAVEEGIAVLVISDRDTSPDRAPIPMLLAVATLHHQLIRSGRRMRVSLVAETGDARDVHQIACLLGFGASAVNPYLALETLRHLHEQGEFPRRSFDEVLANYKNAVDNGVLKIMSKMGISALSSYQGSQIFEAIGIGDEVIACSFPGITSRVGGIGFEDIGRDVLARHADAYPSLRMPRGGWYRFRKDEDYHANAPEVWRALQKAVSNSDGAAADAYQAYADIVHSRPPTALRDLLGFRADREPVPVDEVEDLPEITKRFNTGAMSLGALSPEAHEDLARGMNRMGGRSNTGEGGEDPRRFLPDGDRRDANSKIKQIASGRFGVTP